MTAAVPGACPSWNKDLPGYFELRCNLTEMIGIFRELFRRIGPDETILTEMKPFSVFGASRAKPPMVISFTTTTAHRRRRN
ncbi:hypothetical protein [Bradyrhizobium sp. CCBAU 11386]|uniref:hypothetical protein n=1 Tax=Bradyrhizobium sp. CCBAU 11386 TaxID=1630837 RepID=UPI0023048A47|nr:hypothetical protein [Bradyrhizobium sp. CCBAU 11386]